MIEVHAGDQDWRVKARRFRMVRREVSQPQEVAKEINRVYLDSYTQ